MQVCGNEGEVKAEDISITEDGINVEGVVIVNLICITSDDQTPVIIAKEVVPFSHTIEANGVSDDSIIYIRQCLDSISTTMTNSNEIEVKATVSLDTLVLSAFETNIITDITVSPRNDEHLEAMPGLLGYRIKSGDTLFSIAKEYFTTTDDIIEINSLASENISPGEMLLLVKHPN